MAILEIEGIGDVEVDDAFLRLSPEDQASTVDEIFNSVRGSQEAIPPEQPEAPPAPQEGADEIVSRGEFLPIGRTASGEAVPALPEFLEGPRQIIADLMSGRRAAQDITPEEILGLGAVFAGGGATARLAQKAIPKPKPSILARTGTKLETAAGTQAQRQRTDFLDDLVSPKLTQKVREDRAARTGPGGVFRTGKVEPTVAERSMADVVGDIPGVVEGNTLTKNLQAVNAGIGREATRLEKAVKEQPFKISREAMIAERKALQVRLDDNPLLVGDAAKVAKRVGRKAEMILKDKPATGSGMLAARKELDAWIKTQRPKIFDPAQESALSVAVREVRQSMNTLVDQSAPSVGVRQSLQRQSNLFNAADNIAAKAADEAGSLFERFRKNIAGVVGFKETVGAAGIGAVIGGAALVKIIASGLVISAAGKAILSPAAKRAAGKLLRQSEIAIRTATNPKLLAALRADRSAMIALLKGKEAKPEGSR